MDGFVKGKTLYGPFLCHLSASNTLEYVDLCRISIRAEKCGFCNVCFHVAPARL